MTDFTTTEITVLNETLLLEIARRHLGERVYRDGDEFVVDVKSRHGDYTFEAGYLARDRDCIDGNVILIDRQGDADRFCCTLPTYVAG